MSISILKSVFNNNVDQNAQAYKSNHQFFKLLTVLDSGNHLPCEKELDGYIDKFIEFTFFQAKAERRKDMLIYGCYIIPFVLFSLQSTTKNSGNLISLILPVLISFVLYIIIELVHLYGLNRLKIKYCMPIIVMNLSVSLRQIYSIRINDILDNVKCINDENLSYVINFLDLYKKSGNAEKQSESTKKQDILEIKGNLILTLENSALYLEEYMPKRLLTNDVITNMWFKQIMQQAANALREKKKWVLTPKKDTYKNLTTAITNTLVCLIEDNWDALEHLDLGIDVLRSSRSRGLTISLLNLFKTLIISLVPLLFFLSLQLTPYAIQGPFQNYIILGLLLWVGITFLIKYDPDMTTKLSLIKNYKDLITNK